MAGLASTRYVSVTLLSLATAVCPLVSAEPVAYEPRGARGAAEGAASQGILQLRVWFLLVKVRCVAELRCVVQYLSS